MTLKPLQNGLFPLLDLNHFFGFRLNIHHQFHKHYKTLMFTQWVVHFEIVFCLFYTLCTYWVY